MNTFLDITGMKKLWERIGQRFARWQCARIYAATDYSSSNRYLLIASMDAKFTGNWQETSMWEFTAYPGPDPYYAIFRLLLSGKKNSINDEKKIVFLVTENMSSELEKVIKLSYEVTVAEDGNSIRVVLRLYVDRSVIGSKWTSFQLKPISNGFGDRSNSLVNGLYGKWTLYSSESYSEIVGTLVDTYVHKKIHYRFLGSISSYSVDGTDPVNGKAVASAISGLTKVAASSVNGNIKIDGSETTVYAHPTTAGNKHIPSGGATGKILGYGGSDGTASWIDPPAPDSDIFHVTIGSTSFDDVRAAYTAGKKLVGLVGVVVSGGYTAQFEIPLNRVVLNGSTITQFCWTYVHDSYPNGSTDVGVLSVYKLSSSGWTTITENVAYAANAGNANSAGYANVINDFGGSGDDRVAVGWRGTSINKVSPSGSDAYTHSKYLAGYYKQDGVPRVKDVLAENVTVGDSNKWGGYSIVVGSTGDNGDTIYFV